MKTDEQKFKNGDIIYFYDKKSSANYFGRILNCKPNYCHNEKTDKYEWKYKVGVSFPSSSERFESDINLVDTKIFTDGRYDVDLDNQGGLIIYNSAHYFKIKDIWLLIKSATETAIDHNIFDAINNLRASFKQKT